MSSSSVLRGSGGMGRNSCKLMEMALVWWFNRVSRLRFFLRVCRVGAGTLRFGDGSCVVVQQGVQARFPPAGLNGMGRDSVDGDDSCGVWTGCPGEVSSCVGQMVWAGTEVDGDGSFMCGV